jgi:hypothetical protein
MMQFRGIWDSSGVYNVITRVPGVLLANTEMTPARASVRRSDPLPKTTCGGDYLEYNKMATLGVSVFICHAT